MKRTKIIAEIGVNHNGNFEIAKKMVECCKMCQVDVVKFQTFNPSQLASIYAQKAEYQIANTGHNDSQLNMLSKLVLEKKHILKLKEYCESLELEFMSTPFDITSVQLLESINVQTWKIPSGEITNLPYLLEIAKTGKPVIMSTGMSTMEDIENAINVLKTNCSGDITLLHCNTEYPTPYCDVNLNAMKTMREKFKLPIGYSDHTNGIEVPIAAVAMGATVIEKHFTLDKNMEGPDHKASLEPDELKQMVKSIRNIELAIGDGIKRATQSEQKNIAVVRKSIVAKRDIKKGEIFSEENITTKRPGNGISPMKWFDVIGTIAKQDFLEDELIRI